MVDFAFLSDADRLKGKQKRGRSFTLHCNMTKIQNFDCSKFVIMPKVNAASSQPYIRDKIVSQYRNIRNLIVQKCIKQHKISRMPFFDALMPLRFSVINILGKSDLRPYGDGPTVIFNISHCTKSGIREK